MWFADDILLVTVFSVLTIRTFAVHIMFVMLKIFRVPSTHEMLSHTKLSEYDLSQLISDRFSQQERRLQSSAQRNARIKPKPNSSNQDSANSSASASVQAKPLEEGDCCPICQEELSMSENLTFCRVGCGNYIHAACMEVWGRNCINNRKSADEPISCPLCRAKWTATTIEELRVDLGLQKAVSKSRLNILCSVCESPILHTQFRCVICPVFDMCSICARRQKHAQHNLVCRKEGQTQWEPAPVDPQAIARQRQEILLAMQHRELTVADYDLLLQLDASNRISLHEHLASSLPKFNTSLTAQAQAALSEGGSLETFLHPPPPPSCCICGVASNVTEPNRPSFSSLTSLPNASASASREVMRVLPSCGHVAHHRCLIGQFLYQCDASCPLDGTAMLPGLDSENLKLSKRRGAIIREPETTNGNRATGLAALRTSAGPVSTEFQNLSVIGVGQIGQSTLVSAPVPQSSVASSSFIPQHELVPAAQTASISSLIVNSSGSNQETGRSAGSSVLVGDSRYRIHPRRPVVRMAPLMNTQNFSVDQSAPVDLSIDAAALHSIDPFSENEFTRRNVTAIPSSDLGPALVAPSTRVSVLKHITAANRRNSLMQTLPVQGDFMLDASGAAAPLIPSASESALADLQRIRRGRVFSSSSSDKNNDPMQSATTGTWQELSVGSASVQPERGSALIRGELKHIEHVAHDTRSLSAAEQRSADIRIGSWSAPTQRSSSKGNLRRVERSIDLDQSNANETGELRIGTSAVHEVGPHMMTTVRDLVRRTTAARRQSSAEISNSAVGALTGSMSRLTHDIVGDAAVAALAVGRRDSTPIMSQVQTAATGKLARGLALRTSSQVASQPALMFGRESHDAAPLPKAPAGRLHRGLTTVAGLSNLVHQL
jgi:hypothetical protein